MHKAKFNHIKFVQIFTNINYMDINLKNIIYHKILFLTLIDY